MTLRETASKILFACLAACLGSQVVGLAQQRVKLSGYAEYYTDSQLVVEGQRVVAGAKTSFKGTGITGLKAIPLGYEVKVDGSRQPDGRILAKKVEAKPNGVAMFETDVLKATNQLEAMWVERGEMTYPKSGGGEVKIGRIVESGRGVERVRGIMRRLAPPYVDVSKLRVRVVETEEWNASAMGNGAIWVYSGLLEEMSDHELAIILGHELAHYTHEHPRRGAKQNMFTQMAAMAGVVGTGVATSGATAELAQIGALLGATAWQSGYSRGMEDQADRVGLRYTYQGGFDVRKGPRLWEKFREKYGEDGSASNFFFGSHSRPSERIKNLDREIYFNYRDQ